MGLHTSHTFAKCAHKAALGKIDRQRVLLMESVFAGQPGSEQPLLRG